MASSSSTPARKYEVFLSFRGEDTRNTFVGHLYEALALKGIVTFKDDHNLEKGQSISPELMKAIEDSKFAIIVFSKNYASSTWCLEELVKIMECKNTYAKTVIPIFYDVDPSDVRKQKNSFAESFAKHEVNFKDKVQIWKQALEQAANISGEDIRGKNEASRIRKIVENIFKKLPPKASTKDLVGIESHMTKLDSLLFEEPNGVYFVGIWGMGGIGKTTIATAIFEKHIGSFESGCFLPDVSKGKIVDLQKTLLSKVLNLGSEKVDITQKDEGRKLIAERFCSKKVLLVLDDVNDLHQLESLAAEPEWFGSGSRIVITTRDEELLNDVNETYKVDLLSDDEAMHLFCWHAFKQSHPAQDFSQLSKRVVSYAGGLPLALKVLGSHLRRKTINVWESALDRLKDAPEGKIFDVLKISFDGLSPFQKETFLDIACFYRGWKEDDVKERLHSCGFHPVESITVLIQRSLIHLLVGRIQMHDLIEEMGQHVVRQEAKNKPERYRRLWAPKDILNVLTSNTGTAEVEALVLRNGQFAQGTHEGVFKKMKQLRLLDIVDDYLIPNYLPNTLKWLSWCGYPGKYLPKDFPPINLVHLDLGGSSIVETPDVSGMPNLEVLNLERCEDLLEVHPSIGVHKKLVCLNLRGCYELEKFPRIIQMESLESLNLGYNSFVSLPESINRLSCLQVLNLRGCKMLEALPEVPSSIKKLDLRACRALTRIPSLVDLFGNCKDLTFLSLVGCGQLVKNPRSPTITCDPLAFRDWIKRSASNVLCTRQEVLKVILPDIEIPDWFYRIAMPCVTITLPPSWFNDKLRGFALFADSFDLRFELHTRNGLVSFDDDDDDIYDDIDEGGATFWYIPISKITRDREWKDQNDSFLFEIKNYGEDVSWGIRLVYEGEVDQDITHLTITITDPKRDYWAESLKVCVAPRIHEEKPRDKQLLNKIGDIYKSDDEAMNLFCSHAFKQSHPAQDFFELSNRVVSNAHGIRLALEVLGSHLCGQRIDVWESALDRLKDAPEYTIFTSLEISFEGLSNIEQNIFLDIACFYRGWNEDNVKKRLHSRGFHPDEGIPVLIQRSLIHILDGKIEMHDLIEEMGQYIVRQKGNFKPQRYSRLWFQYDICNVLLNNMGTAEIECLVDRKEGMMMSFIEGINLSRTFRKMDKLRLLDIVTWGSKFSEDCGYLPNTLQWLSWRGYPGKYLPKGFQPINLVHLDLSCSSIVETPDVSSMPNLEVLDLEYCYELLEVHPSIGVHKKLVRLSLRGCKDLFKNPDGDEAVPCSDSQPLPLKRKRVEYDGPLSVLRSLPSLRTLDMSNCNVSEAIIPESIGCLASLQELYLRDNNFVSLPESINRLSCLQVLDLSYCKMLQALPEPPSSIKNLDLSGCTALTRVPSLVDILGKCEDLQYLSLQGCKQLLLNPRCVSNILCTRHEVLQVYLPGREIPDWFLYQSRWGQVTVTLSPSSYNDKLRGFALCVGGYFSLKLSTCNGPMTLIGDYYYLWSGTAFLYIPIGTITSGRDQWKDQKDSFLFEVTNSHYGQHTSWGIRLVYEGEVDQDITHLTFTNDDHDNRRSRLKVCVTARNES